MDVRQLKYFVAVVNKGSFTKAAELLGIAQPSLGTQIRNLEDELQVQLLVRAARGVQLTTPGRVLFEGAQQIIADMADLRKRLTNMAEEPHGRVTLGITPSLADHLLIPLIEQCRQQFPKVELSITEDMSHTITELIEIGQLDLGLIFNAKPMRGLTIHPVATEGICLLTRPTFGKATTEPLEFSALKDYPLILPRRPNRLRLLADEGAERCKIKLNIVFEMQSLSTILRLVEHGYGATLIAITGSSQRAIQGWLVSRPLINPSLQHDISLVHIDSKPLSRAEHAVAGILEELAASTCKPPARNPSG